MRFAVISDLHANLAATEAALAAIDALELPVDVVVCAGDVVGQGAHPNEVIDLLRSRNIDSVLGNYDEAAASQRATSGEDYPTPDAAAADAKVITWLRQTLSPDHVTYLRSLPLQVQLAVGGRRGTAVKAVDPDPQVTEARKNVLTGFLLGSMVTTALRGPDPRRVRTKKGSGPPKKLVRRVVLVHGTPRATIERLQPSTNPAIFRSVANNAKADMVVHGHTRMAFQQVLSGTAFVGVGSTGRAGTSGQAEFAIIDVAGPEIDLEYATAQFDPESEARAIERAGLPQIFADRLRGVEPSGATR